jgi:UDP-N-acetylglucosamine 4,6-dehydratase/5-epimerase
MDIGSATTATATHATDDATPRDFGCDPGVLNDCSVLVTGATGSFGRTFVKMLLERGKARRIAVFSRDELKQYEMEQELRDAGLDLGGVRFFLGDVRDQSRLELAMNGVDTVIHAAALKQVPAAEYNPFECIHTNVLGAENVVRAAIRCGVRHVLALSTDKASAPINLYGASKLASDKIFIAANNLSGEGGCKFSVVRYGNVMGSRGSVVPLFRRLIDRGMERLPITDERMTRFWITLDQGVAFVISCLSRMQGGELFVPKIPSIRIVDLAEAMAPGMPCDIVGIRPGEKLHESMITEDDARTTIELPDRFVIQPPAFPFWREERYAVYGDTYVPEFFRYSSELNDEWLSVRSIRAWLEVM